MDWQWLIPPSSELLALPTLNSSCRLNLELYRWAYNTERLSIQVEISTMGISKMGREKELGSKHWQMARKILHNIILINYMAVESWNLQMVTSIGGNSRMLRRKDMEHLSGLMDTDKSGSGWRITCTAMEYSDGLMEENIMDNGKNIRWMVTDITRVVLV
jgi:hypothetical protein